MRMMFGDGKIAVCTARLKGETIENMVVFLTDTGPGNIGAEVPGVVGQERLHDDDSVQFYFANVDSVQVVIDALEKVKTAISSNIGGEVVRRAQTNDQSKG